jgi:hypothetical protein
MFMMYARCCSWTSGGITVAHGMGALQGTALPMPMPTGRTPQCLQYIHAPCFVALLTAGILLMPLEIAGVMLKGGMCACYA